MDRESFRNNASTSVDANWYNTEKGNRQTNVNKAQRNLDEVDPYYENLFGELSSKQKNSQKALTASMIKRGVGRSGIMTGAESELGQTYAKLNANLGTEKERRKGELTDLFTGAQTSLTGIEGERSSKIEEMISSLYNVYLDEENKRAQAEAARAQTKAYSSSGYNNNAPTAPAATKLTRSNYDNDLNAILGNLRAFQAAGYKGNVGSIADTVAELTRKYQGVVPAKEIAGYVNELYNQHNMWK